MSTRSPKPLKGRGADRRVGSALIDGPGAGRHTWIFASALLLGFALAAVDGISDGAFFAAAAVLMIPVAAGALALRRAPAGWWARSGAPLLSFAAIACLIEAAGGASSGLAPLVLVPMFWLTIHGTRRDLLAGFVVLAMTLAVPVAVVGGPRYPSGEWNRVVLWLVVGGVVGLTVQELVHRIRRGAAAGDALKTAIVESALDCVVIMDHRGRIVEFNPAAERTFGYARREAVGGELAELLLPAALRDRHRQGLRRYLTTGEATVMDRRLELVATRSDGEEFPVELTITRIPDVEPALFAGYIRDLTDRRRAERGLAAQHAVAGALAESSSPDEAIARLLPALGRSMGWEVGAGWLVDEEREVLRCKGVWQEPTVADSGFRAASVTLLIPRGSGPLGRVWDTSEIATSDDTAHEPGYHRAEVAQRMGLDHALLVPIRSGDRVVGVLEFYGRRRNPLDDGLLDTLTTVGSQIGEFLRRRRAEHRLAHQALHDGLTGLANRDLLLDRLRHALDRAAREDTSVAVLFMDLDDFKLVNDSLGHQVGDRLLIAVADRLRKTLRTSDTVSRPGTALARLGGDEFVLVCEGMVSDADAIRVAERIREDLARPFMIDGHELAVSASIGVAHAHEKDADSDTLLRDADAAMYRAKERGRGLYQVFDEALRMRVLERVGGESELRRAIERDELRLHYQPIVAVEDGTLRAFEALIRWEHPERGLVAPAEFIPLAEQTSLIHPIGRWVIAEACRQAARWRRQAAGAPVRVSVNLSTRQLADRQLVATVDSALRQSATEPHCLTLEMTESLLMEEGESSIEMLQQLRGLGVGLALDDFGTGYSSLSYLRRFPLDALKLDRSFVSELDTGAASAIIAAVVDMSRALGMSVIAEGVETPEQLDTLRGLGCPLAQGFYFARPMPPDEAARWLSQPGGDAGQRSAAGQTIR